MDDSSVAIFVYALLSIGFAGLTFFAGYELGFNKRGWLEAKRRHMNKLIEFYNEFKKFPENTPEIDKRKAMKILKENRE